MTFTSDFGYHGWVSREWGSRCWKDKKSPNLTTLTEAGEGSEDENPQKESLHDEEGLLRRLSRGSPPMVRDGARGSADERTLSSSAEGICGSSDQLIPRPPVVSCLPVSRSCYLLLDSHLGFGGIW